MPKGVRYILATALLAVGAVYPNWGQLFVIDSLQPGYMLREEVEVLDASAESLTIEDMLGSGVSENFVPLSSVKGSFQAGRFYWARARIANRLSSAGGQSGWVFHFAPSLTYIDAFIVQAGRVSSSHHSGFFRPYYEKEFRPRIQPNLIKVTLEPGETATLYFKARSDRMAMPPEFWVEIQPADVFWSQLGKHYWSNGIFLGFVLMMLVYNLILSFFAWDKAHFFYSFYLVTIIGYQLYASRLLADWLAPRVFVAAPQYLYFFKLVAYGGLVAYLGFIRSFLNLEELLPGWDRLFRWLMILAGPVLLADAFLIWYSNYSPDIADWTTLPFTFVFLISTFLFVWPLYRAGRNKGYFIVAGILFMGLGILFTMIERLQSIEYSVTYFRIGSVLEIVAFALGLAYSRRLEARERQQAKFALEKSRLLQEKEHAEKERLQELNDLKSLLYANVTHEFRTPLTVILGMVSEIKGYDKARSIIQRNGNNMLRLVNQMLALSRAESGQMKLNLIQADIVPFLQYQAESFQSIAAGKNIRLSFHSEAGELPMDFDEEKVQHIAYNLLSNALKFTPEHGHVAFDVRQEEEGGQPFLHIVVQDSGVGISQEELPHIFDRFFSKQDGAQSTGIGLALAKELAEMMGGSISVESEPGAGSRFIVRIPITRNADRTAPSLQDHWGYESPVPEENRQLPEETEQPAPVAKDEEAPILLLVEDNPDIVAYIRTILEADYSIYFATNGKEGLPLAIEQVPDLIISDVMMPEMDGFELCRQLKQDERTSHIPIILLTARAADEDRIKGLERGADAYLTKPFHKQELLVRIEKLIEKQERLRQYFSGNKTETAGVEKEEEVAIENAFLQKIKALVEESLSDQELSIASLCEAASLSHTQVYRKLKALTDKTPSQFIRSIRLEKAVELLKTTGMNISEVAYTVGFSDPNYFSRSFQQEFGASPSSIRKN